MIGAFFMATDYVTSPITPTGKIIYGLVIGILAAVFRLYGTQFIRDYRKIFSSAPKEDILNIKKHLEK